ncbi:MAG: ZIP family metal transporter [bacterium]
MTVALNQSLAQRHAGKFAALAAGILITTAFKLLPEALETFADAPYYALAGYVFLLLTNLVFGSDQKGLAIFAPVIAIGLHSFIDGLEYGILFAYDFSIASVTSLGLVIHEFAEGVILFMLLLRGGAGKFFGFILAFIGAALTTPLGAVISVSMVDSMDDAMLGKLLSIAAGALIYVGATHLVQHMRDPDTGRVSAISFLLLGIFLAFGLTHL